MQHLLSIVYYNTKAVQFNSRIASCCYSAILSPPSYSGKMSPMNTREEIYHMTEKEMARL